jgi:acyl carrier protein
MDHMSATRDRLLECFSTVFPGRAEAELTQATIDNLPTWDSSNHILLMQVIEEQFGFPVDDDRMGELLSFKAIEEYLDGEGRPH